jgi:hypothetical protein
MYVMTNGKNLIRLLWWILSSAVNRPRCLKRGKKDNLKRKLNYSSYKLSWQYRLQQRTAMSIRGSQCLVSCIGIAFDLRSPYRAAATLMHFSKRYIPGSLTVSFFSAIVWWLSIWPFRAKPGQLNAETAQICTNCDTACHYSHLYAAPEQTSRTTLLSVALYHYLHSYIDRVRVQ